jgi:hypothetical protein
MLHSIARWLALLRARIPIVSAFALLMLTALRLISGQALIFAGLLCLGGLMNVAELAAAFVSRFLLTV